jgi:hypothetical protein
VPQFRESNENDYPSVATEEEEPQVSTHAVAPIRILKRATEEMVVESAVDSTKVFQEDEETVSLSKRDYLEPLGDEMSEFEGAEDMTGDLITWKSDTTLVGFLISYDNDKKGQYVELRTGRLMVTSEFESSGNCFVVRHPSVSPMHAIMRVGTSGSVQVLDQLSEHGTRIKHVGVEEEEFLSGEKGVVNHGDIVYFGDRAFYVCLITPPSE